MGRHSLPQLDELPTLPVPGEQTGSNNDLIFVGSPAKNLTLLDLPGTQEFVFQRVASGARKGDLGVLRRSQSGEPQMFLASLSTQPTTEDYAVIALVPGIDPARSVLICWYHNLRHASGSGICVPGRFAGAVIAASQHLETGDMKPFEALLHVEVTHGVPVITDLVTVRKRAG